MLVKLRLRLGWVVRFGLFLFQFCQIELRVAFERYTQCKKRRLCNMLIHLKGCYTILGEINSNSKDDKIQLKVPFKNKKAVIVNIIPDENSVESFHEFEVSKEMWDVLQTDICDGRKLPLKLQTELQDMKSDISKATKKILSLIKYCLNQPKLSENLYSSKGIYWSRGKSKWKRLPEILSSTIVILNFINLNENTASAIQDYIENDFEPILALRHLHRAKRENNPRYKWIDATIAAELAIKEFLIILKPDIETLLLELPSPPLHKLYGSILEFYTNERSPKLKELAKGAEIRNKLIHRPKEMHINTKQANKYIQDVEIAIYHLLTLLYPNDSVMKSFYKPRAVLS